MNKLQPLNFGSYYHIYNRGNNSENLFLTTDNYTYFLSLYDKYITLVADTYAWCLMPNHFHLLIRVKEEEEIRRGLNRTLNLTGLEFEKNLSGLKDLTGLDNDLSGLVSQKFSNLFNAYSKAFNKRETRHGSLFESPFKRIEVHNEAYLRQLVYYIHSNPLKHGFVDNMLDWPWSSYLTIISVKPSKLQRSSVLGWFDSHSNFIAYHKEQQELDLIKFSLLED